MIVVFFCISVCIQLLFTHDCLAQLGHLPNERKHRPVVESSPADLVYTSSQGDGVEGGQLTWDQKAAAQLFIPTCVCEQDTQSLISSRVLT